MTTNTTRRRLLGGVAAGATATLAGCSGMTPFVGQQLATSETMTADDVDALRIYGDAGDITVLGGNRDEITVDVEKQSSSIRTDLENLELGTERTDGVLELRSEWDGSEGWLRDRPSMTLEIDAPREVALESIQTSVGRVTVRDVAGDLRVDTSTGRVDVVDVDGGVGANTSTGRVEIRDVEYLDDVSTNTGRVEAEVPAIDVDPEAVFVQLKANLLQTRGVDLVVVAAGIEFLLVDQQISLLELLDPAVDRRRIGPAGVAQRVDGLWLLASLLEDRPRVLVAEHLDDVGLTVVAHRTGSSTASPKVHWSIRSERPSPFG